MVGWLVDLVEVDGYGVVVYFGGFVVGVLCGGEGYFGVVGVYGDV